MGLLAPVLAAGFGPALVDGYWTNSNRYSLTDGVSLDDALAIPAFYDGVALISEDIAKAPCHIFEDLGEAGRRHPENMPLEELLQYAPNPWQTAFEFKEFMTACSMLRQFGIAEIIPGRRGPVDQLVPLHPDLVREETKPSHRFLYRDPKHNGEERALFPDEVFVIRGRLGRSVLDFASRNLAVDAAIERYAGTLFARGARPQAVVKHPAELSDSGRKNLRKILDEFAIAGPRSGRPMLLEEGLEWQDIGLTNRDAQFMENRKWGVRQVARWLRLPPHKLADLQDANYSNVEQENINYVTDTLLTWAIRWEQAIRRDLIVPKSRYFAKLNLDILLRGDLAARALAYSAAIQWGWMTRNEVRAHEDLNPLPGLDRPLRPLNMSDTSASVDDLTPAARAHLRLLAADAAERVVTRERTAVAKFAEHSRGDRATFTRDVEGFYAEHAGHVSDLLHIPMDVAREDAAGQRAAIVAGKSIDDDWVVARVGQLTALVLSSALGAAA